MVYIIMSHRKHTHQKHMQLCCTPHVLVSTNHKARFSLLVTWQ